MNIRAIVTGAAGRMGRQVVAALAREPDIEVAGGVDLQEQSIVPDPERPCSAIEVTSDLTALIARACPDVLVDFTRPESVMGNVRTALEAGVRCVVGTTGLGRDDLEEIKRMSDRRKIGAVVAPNFAIGAVLMMQFAEMASRHFHASEIIEMHHDAKVDAPSGTAIKTAWRISDPGLAAREAAASDEAPCARGENIGGTRIHSVRLPGLVAHHEVIFGGPGQALTIRHDSFSRESFMPGVILAVREVMRLDTAVFGLEHLLGL